MSNEKRCEYCGQIPVEGSMHSRSHCENHSEALDGWSGEEIARAGGRSPNKFARFGEMNWPLPTAAEEIQWRLRYAPEQLTRGDQLVAASILSAYSSLVRGTQRRRNYVVRELRSAMENPA